MTVTGRIDWSTALTGRATVVPVLLVAGIPFVMTPAGVHPTTVSTPGGTTVDPLWWPGSGTLQETIAGSPYDPVREWLGIDAETMIETFQAARLVEGDVTVEALTLQLLDPDGAVTGELSIRDGRTARSLAADITASALSIPTNSGTGLPASGIAAIGRETVLYDSISTNSLVLPTGGRGKYGSRARRHLATAINPPVVSFGGARHWQGRVASVWLCTLSDDGTTLGAPTLLYLGTVGAAVQLNSTLTRWSVPLDSVTETLLRRYPTRTIELWGINHFAFRPDPWHIAAGASFNSTGGWLTSQDGGGWHGSWGAWIATFNALGPPSNPINLSLASIAEGGRLSFRMVTTGAPITGAAWAFYAPWNEPPRYDDTRDSGTSWTTTSTLPEAFIMLDQRVKIPSAVDFASIPSTFSVSQTSGDFQGRASFALLTDGDDRIVSAIIDRRGSDQTIDLSPVGLPAGLSSEEIATRCRLLERTTVNLGIVAEGDSPLGALRQANVLLASLYGTDLEDAAIDWDGIARAFASQPLGGIPQARRYIFDGKSTLLAPLLQECRLRGLVLGVWFGRVTAYALAKFASTEPLAASITELDLVAEDGSPIMPEVIDNTQPLATSMEFKLWDDSIIRYVDTTWQSEFGDTGKIECSALKWVPSEQARGDLLVPLYEIAQMLLGPAAEPQRIIRVVLPARFFSLQPGDLVSLTHYGIPSWTGTRGLVDATCQVQEIRHTLYGGRARVVAGLRLQSGDLAGYAPEALVAAGGLSSGSPVVSLDTLSGFGANCFAYDVDVDGNDRTVPSDGFAVGAKVLLSQYDAESPIADESFTIVAVSDATITLDGNPSVAMAAAAATQYGVIVRFQSWPNVVTEQQRYAFIADAVGGDLDGDAPKRWA